MKHKIVICMGSSCFARGNERNIQTIQDFLNDNRLEADIELMGTLCENICSEGPNIAIDGVMYHQVDNGKLSDLLSQKLLDIEPIHK